MNQELLDSNNYTFAGGFPVGKNRNLAIPESIVLAPTMLVKWQIRQLIKGATIEQVPPTTLSLVLEIPGMGTLETLETQILPSQQGKDIVQLLTIDPSLPYRITFSAVSDLVTNSVLEFYAYTGLDPNTNYQSNYLPIMGVNNPASTDPAALQQALAAVIPQMAQAIGVQSGAAVQQALANQAIANESKNSTTALYVIKAWSGDIKNHLIIQPNPVRMSVSASHSGKLLSPGNTSDVYIAVGSPNNRDFIKYEYVLSAGGTYISDPERDTLATYMWLLPGKPDATINITEYLP